MLTKPRDGHVALAQQKPIRTRLSQFLEEQVYPTVFSRLTEIFPEFAFVARGAKFQATEWPADFPIQAMDPRPDRLQVDAARPWGVHCHGHRSIQWLTYLNHGVPPRGRAFIDAVRDLCTRAGVPFPEGEPTEQELRKSRDWEARREALSAIVERCQLEILSPKGAEARAYLEGRGISRHIVEQFGLGLYPPTEDLRKYLKSRGIDPKDAARYSVLTPRMSGYVIIPWHEPGGSILTLYGRWPGELPAIEDHPGWSKAKGKHRGGRIPKTNALWAEGSKGSPLFFDRAIRARTTDTIIATEGLFDGLMLQAHGEVNTVSYVGGEFSKLQVETLKRHRVERVIVCADPDAGGDRGAVYCVRSLRAAGLEAFVATRLPDGLDPDEFIIKYGIDAWREHISDPTPGAEHEARWLAGDVEPDSPEIARREAARTLVGFSRTMADALDRDRVIEVAVERTGFPAESLRELADAPPGGSAATLHAAANGRPHETGPEPTHPPIDVKALKAKASSIKKLPDLVGDVEFLRSLGVLHVVDQAAAVAIDASLRDALGKKYVAKVVKDALAPHIKAARRPLDQPKVPRPDLPEIIVNRRIHEVVADAAEAIVKDPEVYQRGPSLVRIVENTKPPKGLKGTEGTPQIVLLPATRILELLSRSARWVMEVETKDGGVAYVPADPNGTYSNLIRDRADYPGARVLERVVESPCLRPDGTVLQRAGFDIDTGLFFRPDPDVKFPVIPDNPTLDDAKDALDELLYVVQDFPFAPIEDGSPSPHKYAWVSALLTAACRSAIPGPCPCFMFTANTAGSGKTKLCDLISWILTGRKMPPASYTDNQEEMAKVLFSIALGGFPFVFFDNIATGFAFGGPELDKVLTSVSYYGRILGVSEMRSVPFYSNIFVTGNNIGLKGDIHRRIVPCRLESPHERPEERTGFKIPDLKKHVMDNRGALVAAALTIIRAFVCAGKPEQGLTPMDFPEWSGLIRNAAYWASGVDPCGARAEVRDDDDSANELVRLVDQWQVVSAREKKEFFTAGEMINAVKDNASVYADMHEVLVGMSKRGDDLASPDVLGKRLAKYLGRVVGDGDEAKAFGRRTVRGKTVWFIRTVTPPKSGGRGGRGGLATPYPARGENFLTQDKCHREGTGTGGGGEIYFQLGMAGGKSTTATTATTSDASPEPPGPREPGEDDGTPASVGESAAAEPPSTVGEDPEEEVTWTA